MEHHHVVNMVPRDENKEIYSIVDGIKIYSNVTPKYKSWAKKNMEYYKSKTRLKLLTKLIPSVLTAQGAVTNVIFKESIVIYYADLPRGDILSICCNWGELINPDYKIPPKKPKSGRGRKPKPKPQSSRKKQGSGKYFSSMLQFLIQNPVSKKQFKIKLFRNGTFQVPGVIEPLMHELVMPIKILKRYLSNIFVQDNIEVEYISGVMRNYKCKFLNTNHRLILTEVETAIVSEKLDPSYNKLMNYMTDGLNDDITADIIKLVGNQHPMKIAEFILNPERCSGLVLYFFRPKNNIRRKINDKKKLTAKIMASGKINFSGANNEDEAFDAYHWLEYFFNKYYDRVVFDITQFDINGSHIKSDPDDDSIYDDDVDDNGFVIRK